MIHVLLYNIKENRYNCQNNKMSELRDSFVHVLQYHTLYQFIKFRNQTKFTLVF